MPGGKTACASAAVVLAAVIFAPYARAAGTSECGAPIIDKSIRLKDPQDAPQRGERYSSPKNFDETVKFYRRLLRFMEGVEFRKISAPAGIRAVHIENKAPDPQWSGMNIYESKGQTRIFVIPGKGGCGKKV
jgi:hypothetical protein